MAPLADDSSSVKDVLSGLALIAFICGFVVWAPVLAEVLR